MEKTIYSYKNVDIEIVIKGIIELAKYKELKYLYFCNDYGDLIIADEKPDVVDTIYEVDLRTNKVISCFGNSPSWIESSVEEMIKRYKNNSAENKKGIVLTER